MRSFTESFLCFSMSILISHCIFADKVQAATRIASVSIPVSTYHYLSVTNIFSIVQTVTLRFTSTGVNLKAGGYHYNITGWSVPGGPVASNGVSCSANVCSLTATLSKGQSIRMGVRIEKGAVPDYRLSAPSFSNASNVGLLADVSVAEDSGRVVASALAWTDIDVSPSMFIDSAKRFNLNGGKPF